MSIGRNDYTIYITEGIAKDAIVDALSDVVGIQKYRLFPGRFLLGFEQGVSLRGWPKADVETFINELTSRLHARIMPNWMIEDYEAELIASGAWKPRS